MDMFNFDATSVLFPDSVVIAEFSAWEKFGTVVVIHDFVI